MPKTVGVAVSNATFHFDKLYTYAVMPDQQNAVKLGSMVLVPFGRGSRARMGVAALAKGHQHHTAQTHRILVLRQNSVGIQLIKMEGRIADGNAYRFGHSSNSFNA